MVISGKSVHSLPGASSDSSANHTGGNANNAQRHPLRPYLDYVAYLHQRMDPLPEQERFELMGNDSIIQKQGEQHRCLCELISHTLGHSAGLEALVPKMCDSVQLHLDSYWHGQDTLSLYCSTKVLTFNIVFECLLGIKVEPRMLETFDRVLEGVFAPAFSFLGSKFSRAKKARQEIEKVLVKVVKERTKKIEGGRIDDDHHHYQDGMLLSQLATVMIRGDITEEEVIDSIVLLVFTAHDTTSFAIVMTFKLLAQYPNYYSLLLQEHVEIMKAKKSGDVLRLDDIKKIKYTWQVAREREKEW